MIICLVDVHYIPLPFMSEEILGKIDPLVYHLDLKILGLVGLVVVSVNGVYWLLAFPNLWNFSKETWKNWICCCCKDDLMDLEDDDIWGA